MLSWYWKTVWVLLGFFLIAHATYLGTVPGLLGDEGSEGENVWELLQSDHLVVQGERSYIGPLIDYVRVPFVKVFGYTPLALRSVMLLASCATFWLAASVLKKMFGETPALFALALGFFNPIYLTQARLGWAITLIPFFVFLILWLLFRHPRGVKDNSSGVAERGASLLTPGEQASSTPGVESGRALLLGVVAGIGLSNHILFLPTLVGIVISGIGYLLLQKDPSVSPSLDHPPLRKGRKILAFWPALIGFWAGFGMQFVVLLSNREDQGDVGAVAQGFVERVHDLPKLLPLVLSGSSYIASYTGVGFSEMWQWMITLLLLILILAALVFSARRKIVLLSIIGLAIQTVVLLYMIDRFSLRYFVAPVVGRWLLAGVGFGVLIDRLHLRSVSAVGPVVLALGLIGWSAFAVLIPFLKTGGSTSDFSLGNRTDSAAAQVDIRPLLACVRGAGPIYSESVHIWNRLQYLSHEYSDLEVLPEDQKSKARILVEYRDVKHLGAGTLCPDLAHFRVIAK